MSEFQAPKNLQVEAEIAALAEILRRENVWSLLEIGSKHGGSLWPLACAMPRGARIVCVDLPGGTKEWKQSKISLERTAAELRRRGQHVTIIWGDSTAPDVVERVRAHAPFNAVFIDANHTLPYVEKDWANYGDPGMGARIVAFHDIAWRRAPEWVGTRIDVPQFWDRIKGGFRHEEFRLCPTGKNNGIGVLWCE